MKGDLVREIRKLASARKPFSWRSVRGRFAVASIKRMVIQLYQRGELKRLLAGQSGRGGSPAVYRGK